MAGLWILMLLYFLPWLVAQQGKRRALFSFWIGNLLIGWFILLYVAATDKRETCNDCGLRTCPHCGEKEVRVRR